jgi:hypothetical protein
MNHLIESVPATTRPGIQIATRLVKDDIYLRKKYRIDASALPLSDSPTHDKFIYYTCLVHKHSSLSGIFRPNISDDSSQLLSNLHTVATPPLRAQVNVS